MLPGLEFFLIKTRPLPLSYSSALLAIPREQQGVSMSGWSHSRNTCTIMKTGPLGGDRTTKVGGVGARNRRPARGRCTPPAERPPHARGSVMVGASP